jgi:6-phosphofructokinase 2
VRGKRQASLVEMPTPSWDGADMACITTLTLNPAIDGAAGVDAVRHTVKLRTHGQRFDPGGGGINVARVIARLGGDVQAVYLAGGVTGPLLDGLVDRAGVPHRRLPIAGDTRISLVVREDGSGHEYRFVPEGPVVSADEAAAALAEVAALDCEWLVLSGSLPRGLDADFMAEIVRTAVARGQQVVLDTSGPALAACLAVGGICFAKPSLEELEALAGGPLRDASTLLAAARRVVEAGGARMLAVTLGGDGGLLVTREGELRLPALPVPHASAVGAGDSFTAAMTWALASGRDAETAFRLGMAAGAAAVMTPGTDLAHANDIVQLAASLGIAL